MEKAGKSTAPTHRTKPTCLTVLQTHNLIIQIQQKSEAAEQSINPKSKERPRPPKREMM